MKYSFCILLFFTFKIYGQSYKKDTIQFGLYIKSISDLSPQTNSFSADFYIWSNSSDSTSVFNQVEIVNAKKKEEFDTFIDRDEGKKRFVGFSNCKAQIRHDWNLFKYPFDYQTLKIRVEAQDGRDYVELIQDKNDFRLDSELHISGWKLVNNFIDKDYVTYPVDFGYHHTKFKDKRFNRLDYNIIIKRDGWGLYFKLFSSLYLAFFVSFVAFFIRADKVDPRFGVSIGGLFASVANKYVVDSYIPQFIGISLVDIVHIINFLLIFITIVISTLSLKYVLAGQFEKSKDLDNSMGIIILTIYILFNLIILFEGYLS